MADQWLATVTVLKKAGFMRIKKLGVVLILPALAVCETTKQAKAQTAPASAPSLPSPVIALEAESSNQGPDPGEARSIASLQNPFLQPVAKIAPGPTVATSPQAGTQRAVAPSLQSPPMGKQKLGRLRNPYVWDGDNAHNTPPSLFGFMRQQRPEPIYIAPPPRPTTLASPQAVAASGQGGVASGQTGTGMTGTSAYPQMPSGGQPQAGAVGSAASPNGAGMPGAQGQPGMAAPGPDGTATPPAEASPDTSAAATNAALNAAAADAAAAAVGNGPGFGGGLSSSQEMFPMIGDASPYHLNSFGTISARATATTPSAPAAPPGLPSVNPPGPPSARASSVFYPSVRVFKISENMSPRPQDRFFSNMNSYYQVNQDINKKFEVPIRNITAYRYFFGFEKTFNDGKGSFGMRFPVDNVSGTSTAKGVNLPSTTTTGNLSLFGKYIVEENKKTGSLISVGLAITPQTGPTKFAGAPWIYGIGTTSIQPFLGYIWNKGDFYAHGFSAFDFSVNPNDVSLMYNDFGIGYYLIRSNDPHRFLTALVPTVEVHVNTPLNHRDWYRPSDLAGTADIVNLTYGFNFEFNRSAILSTALITPVSSPRPFTAELAILLNIYYGRTKASRTQITPPPVF